MITPAGNGPLPAANDFAHHMAELDRLRRELESGELDPTEALARCKQAETHYRAVDRILTSVERELADMQGKEE